MTTALTLERQQGTLAVVRMKSSEPIPAWACADEGEFSSITRTPEELSIVCAADKAPDDTNAERDWAALKIVGPLSFDQVGILASLAEPLKQAGIPIFVISTYDTDYLLIKEANIEEAAAVLTRAGHVIRVA